jgi:magnesium transporter
MQCSVPRRWFAPPRVPVRSDRPKAHFLLSVVSRLAIGEKTTGMLTAYLFDQRHGKEVEAWTDALGDLSEDQLLWVDLIDPSDEEERAAFKGFDLSAADGLRIRDPAARARLELYEQQIRVTAVAVSDEESDPAREAVVLDCFSGPNWVLTTHMRQIAVIDDFRTLAEGVGELGALDAASFLATLLEWVVTSYSRAFDEIEATLEEFDVAALDRPRRDTDQQISVLVEVRSRVGRLRRSLAPHREVFAALGHSELDLLSTERSADRFAKLVAQVDRALDSARDAKDAVVSSFDVLILRTEHRTGEIVKVLTLASILLLPGALIAGVMGMNVNFSASVFAHSPLFWTVIAAIVVIALTTLGLARVRKWI